MKREHLSGLIVLGLVLANCAPAAPDDIAAVPAAAEATLLPGPSAAVAEPVQEAAMDLEPEEKPGPTPSATLPPVSVDFMPRAGNPILIADPAQSWEAGLRFSTVVFEDGVFHMFYTGGDPFAGGDAGRKAKFAIGYATSTDGFTFTRFQGNPILEGDGSGFDAYSVSRPVVLVEEDTWILYYTAHPQPGHRLGGPAIGRATAPAPTGPWTRSEEPVLSMGSWTEWDGEQGWFGVVPSSVLRTDEGYVMYYTSHHNGDIAGPRVGGACGMATSPDGIRWTKYNDAGTDRPPLAESDPVLRPSGARGLHAMDCRVFRIGEGWGMFYASLREGGSGHQLSFASSRDGIHWIKNDEPVLTGKDEPRAAEAEFPDMWPDAILATDSGYLLYYEIGCCPPVGIGVATGTVGE